MTELVWEDKCVNGIKVINSLGNNATRGVTVEVC